MSHHSEGVVFLFMFVLVNLGLEELAFSWSAYEELRFFLVFLGVSWFSLVFSWLFLGFSWFLLTFVVNY